MSYNQEKVYTHYKSWRITRQNETFYVAQGEILNQIETKVLDFSRLLDRLEFHYQNSSRHTNMFRSINLRCVILIVLASEYCNVTHIVRTLILFFFFLILDYRKIRSIFIPKFARPSRTNTSSYFHFLHY